MKTCYLFFLSALISTVTYAQDVPEKEVPAQIRQAFQQKFSNATKVEWSKEEGVYEAEFILAKKETSASFDLNGTWVETEQEIAVSAIPQAITNSIQGGEFKAWKIKEAETVESAHESGYEIELSNHNEKVALLFSADGKLIKTAREKD